MSLYYRDSTGKETVIASTGVDLADYATLENQVAEIYANKDNLNKYKDSFLLQVPQSNTYMYNIIKLKMGDRDNPATSDINQDRANCFVDVHGYLNQYSFTISCATGKTFFKDRAEETKPATVTVPYITAVYWDSANLTLYIRTVGYRQQLAELHKSYYVDSVQYTREEPTAAAGKWKSATVATSWLYKQ